MPCWKGIDLSKQPSSSEGNACQHNSPALQLEFLFRVYFFLFQCVCGVKENSLVVYFVVYLQVDLLIF